MTTIRLKYGKLVFEIWYDDESFSIEKNNLSKGFDYDLTFNPYPAPFIITPYLKLDLSEGPLFTTFYIEHSSYRFDNGVTVDFGVYREPLISFSENGVHGPKDPDVFIY